MTALAALPLWADALIAVLLLISAATALIGAWGLAKLPDFFMRLHAPTKATTLGVGGVLIASALYFTVRGPGFSLHEFLITLFLFLAAPVSAHLLAKAALQVQSAGGATAPEPGQQDFRGTPPVAATSPPVLPANRR